MDILIDHQIKLCLPSEDQAAPLYQVINSNRVHLSEYINWVENMQTANDCLTYLKNCERLNKEGTEVSFMFFFEKELVGRIGLQNINQQNRIGSIGYWLAQGAVGKGIITKCCQTLINFGFIKLNLNRIEIKAAAENLISQAIPVKFNFVREGVLREAELINGIFHHLILYSLLRSDWPF